MLHLVDFVECSVVNLLSWLSNRDITTGELGSVQIVEGKGIACELSDCLSTSSRIMLALPFLEYQPNERKVTG